MSHRSKLVSCLLLGALVTTVTGCTDSPDPASPTSDLPPLTTPAILDWENANIILPLDAYGMTSQELGLVFAAQSTLTWQCLLQGQDLTPDALNQIRGAMTTIPHASYWLDGRWDAPYVAVKGILPPRLPSLGPIHGSPEDGLAQSMNCYESSDLKDLAAIDRLIVQGDISPTIQPLLFYSDSARLEVREDPRWQALMAQRAACIESKGYTADDDDLRTVEHDATWSEEQTLEAQLAEATCSDDLGIAQRAADVHAAYEQRYVDDHEAELIEVRRIAEDRVAKATAILQEAGVM